MDIILATSNVLKNRKLIDLFKTRQKMIKTMADESCWKKPQSNKLSITMILLW